VYLALIGLTLIVFIQEARITALRQEIDKLYAILEEAKIIKKR